MKTSDFDYTLPEELIAPYPAAQRDASRLMVVGLGDGRIEHRTFSDLPDLLRAGDCLVLNESRVIAARLMGRRRGGGRAEVLLVRPDGEDRWRALVRPGKKLGAGSVVTLTAPGPSTGPSDAPTEIGILIEKAFEGGERLVRFQSVLALDAILDRFGDVPLPPYILAARGRAREQASGASEDSDSAAAQKAEALDRGRYQTVYARSDGSVAAPTAGLHFTEDLLARIEAMGVEIRRIALHIGPGTFAPVKVDDPGRHPMHAERYSIAKDEAEAIDRAVADPDRRVIAVGTTVTRALEACMASQGCIAEGEARTDLLILPGHRFRALDAMITNFHLPRSTLLMLVCALAGRETMLGAYAEAIERRYRFYSYGDAMLIL